MRTRYFLCWLLFLFAACNDSNNKLVNQQSNIIAYFDTLTSEGIHIKVISIAGKGGTFLSINGKSLKTYNLKDVYKQFGIGASGIDLNYAIDNLGNGFYLLNSITNDFSFLIDGNTSSIMKVYDSPIIAIDTANTRLFYYNFTNDTIGFAVEDPINKKLYPISFDKMSDSIFVHNGLVSASFRADGSLYVKWRINSGAEADTIIKMPSVGAHVSAKSHKS